MAVDFHAHYLSPRLLKALAAEPISGGPTMVLDSEGQSRLAMEGGVMLRPLPPGMDELGEQRLAHMDRQGVAWQVVSPWPDVLGYRLPAESAVRWTRLMNDCLAADLVAAGTDRLRMAAVVPLQDPEAAAAEARRAVKELGAVALMIGTHVGPWELDQAELDPFWAAASELAIPILLHPIDPPGDRRLEAYRMQATVGYLFETTLAAARLIHGGVLARFPLSVILSHGGGFLPYQVGRLEHVWQADSASRGASVPPLEGMRQFYYDTITHHPTALRFLIDQVGAERVVVGTDYPFLIGDRDPLAKLSDTGLSSAIVGRVASSNASDLLAKHW